MTVSAEGRVELDSLEKQLLTLLALTFTILLLSGDPAEHYTSFDVRGKATHL